MRRMSLIVPAAGALLAPVVVFAQDENPSIPQPIPESESPMPDERPRPAEPELTLLVRLDDNGATRTRSIGS